ncbi:MAG: hypothetical protein IT578_03370 [Verrucomicrobiae bacterium]|nr:hypothetical protein [Verrucomicrobiae bacterium]
MTPPNDSPTPEGRSLAPGDRDLLMKFFTHRGPGKALTDPEFARIKDHVDPRRGGLTKEAYQAVKADKDLVKASAVRRAQRDHRIMEARLPKAREPLLKLLKAGPGEKVLSLEEFKQVAIFLDRKNGGLRRHAYELLKEDPEIVKAAEKHREAWKERGPKEVTRERTGRENPSAPSQSKDRASGPAKGGPTPAAKGARDLIRRPPPPPRGRAMQASRSLGIGD